MTESITFTCPLPPGPLRRNRETRSNGYRAALIREYQEQVWCSWGASHETRPGCCDIPGAPWERVKVTLVWRHHRMGPDEDNALASCKWLLDVIKATGPRPLAIVVDDSPAHMTVTLRTEKVRTKEAEGVLVTVERVETMSEQDGR